MLAGAAGAAGFDTRPSRAVIKPRPDSYLSRQLSSDLDERRERRLPLTASIKAADGRAGSRLRQPLNRPLGTYRSVSFSSLRRLTTPAVRFAESHEGSLNFND